MVCCDLENCELAKLKDDFGLVVHDCSDYDMYLSDSLRNKFYHSRFVLIRDEDNSGFGRLYLRGVFVCDTLENNLYLIPKGHFGFTYTYSPKFKMFTYEISGVPERQRILVHAGNVPNDSNGCVLVGVREGNVLVNSKVTLDRVLSISKECYVNCLSVL